MGCTSGGAVKREPGGGRIATTDILSERDMIVERQKNPMVDEVLTVAKDLHSQFGLNGQISEFLISELKPTAMALAYYDPISDSIGVNEKYFVGKEMGKAYEDCVKNGFHPSNGNKTAMQAVAAHEFGHALTMKAGKKLGLNNIDHIADKIIHEARKKQGKHKGVVQMSSQISQYATASNAEAIAEAVSDHYCNGNKAKAESKAIVSVLTSYL